MFSVQMTSNHDPCIIIEADTLAHTCLLKSIKIREFGDVSLDSRSKKDFQLPSHAICRKISCIIHLRHIKQVKAIYMYLQNKYIRTAMPVKY